MAFGAAVRKAREARNLRPSELADRAGVDLATLSAIESRDSVRSKYAAPLAAALGASLEDLLQGEVVFNEMLNEMHAGNFVVREPHSERATYFATSRSARVPVVGTAQLGDDGYWLEMGFPTGAGDGWVSYPSRDPNAYAVRCKGDSMRPRIKPGEFVVVEPNRKYAPGDEVLVKDRWGRVMVKVFDFQRGGAIQVSSVNEDHRPITLELAAIDCVHYVAAIIKPSMYYESLA